MRFFLCLFFIAVFVIAGLEVYQLFGQRASLEQEITKFQAQASILESEQGRLLKDIRYFSRDENLLKEFKARFNYRAPEEKLIILVPRPAASGDTQP